MTNHIHIIAEPADDAMTISLMMKRVNGKQSALVNKLEGRTGSLWEGRYKASPIQKDAYLLTCLRYVEMNPIRAGMVRALEDYPWSSYPERAGLNGRTLLDFDSCYLGLGQTDQERFSRYRKYLDEPSRHEDISLIRRGLQRNQLTGNQQFIDEIEQRTGLRIEQRGRGRPGHERK
jgi:putative transposase